MVSKSEPENHVTSDGNMYGPVLFTAKYPISVAPWTCCLMVPSGIWVTVAMNLYSLLIGIYRRELHRRAEKSSIRAFHTHVGRRPHADFIVSFLGLYCYPRNFNITNFLLHLGPSKQVMMRNDHLNNKNQLISQLIQLERFTWHLSYRTQHW